MNISTHIVMSVIGLCVAIVLLLTSGCATSATILTGRQHGRFSLKEGLYPATRLDAEVLSGVPVVWNEESKFELMLEIPFVLMDFPFSLVFDTLLLPYDLLNKGD